MGFLRKNLIMQGELVFDVGAWKYEWKLWSCFNSIFCILLPMQIATTACVVCFIV